MAKLLFLALGLLLHAGIDSQEAYGQPSGSVISGATTNGTRFYTFRVTGGVQSDTWDYKYQKVVSYSPQVGYVFETDENGNPVINGFGLTAQFVQAGPSQTYIGHSKVVGFPSPSTTLQVGKFVRSQPTALTLTGFTFDP